MKKHSFTVTITFEDGISSDEEIQEIAQNVANALKSQADSAGLAPDGSDTFTTKIEVVPQFLPEAKVEVDFK